MRMLILNLLILLSFVFSSCTNSTSSPSYMYKKPTGDGVVLKMGDVVIKESDMVKGIENDIFEAEEKLFNLKMDKLKSMLIEKLINADERKKDLSSDEFLEKYVTNGLKINKGEVDSFIKEKNIPKEHINDQIIERIQGYLLMEKKKVAIEKWLSEKSSKSPVEVFLTKPQRPSFDIDVKGSPSFGSESAKVTLVEYSDFQCPFCAKGADIIKELKKKYGNKIRVVFKNFPLPFHKQAKTAAIAALCMNEQSVDLFWKMHDLMFADQTKLENADLKASAKTLGANEAKFNECLDKNKFIEAVDKDIAQGKELGIKSTPTFFINGQLIAGALPVEEFSAIIDAELAK